ncbi:FMN-binding protein [Alkaliphilus transvaalensis]|uniref:FMN-binding protein n=1 Tax=Alkaliphilus transvaalensis TaxID=114628 RepID=UPI00054E360E|nr:FMN-binding protein [Alkaliphilus transvaalensis]
MSLKKKLLVGVLGLTMVALTACGGSDDVNSTTGGLNDGTYEGTGQGFKGDIKIELVVEDGKVTDLNVLEHGETEGISDAAFEGITEQLLEKQSADLDVITGATMTSEGLIEAIEEALPKASN